MIGKALREFALSFGLAAEKQYAWGEMEGFLVSMREDGRSKSLFVNCALPGEENAPLRDRIKEFIKPYVTPSYLLDYNVGEEGVDISFREGFGTIKRMGEMIAPLLDTLKEYGVPGLGTCSKCGGAIENQEADTAPDDQDDTVEGTQKNETMTLQIKGRVYRYDAAHGKEYTETMDTARQEHAKLHNRYGRGILGGALGMLVGIIPLIAANFFAFQSGLVWLMGLIVGLCVRIGYKRLGGQPGKAKIIILSTISILGIFIASFSGLCIYAYTVFVSQGTYYGLWDIITITGALIVGNATILEPFIFNLLLGMITALLSLIGVGTSIRKARDAYNFDYEVLD